MARKKAEGVSPPLPSKFEDGKTYMAVVKTGFYINKFFVKPGTAMLRGEVAQANRDKLVSAWISE